MEFVEATAWGRKPPESTADADAPTRWFAAFESRLEARFDSLVRECSEVHAGMKLDIDNLKDEVQKLTAALKEADLKIDDLENRSRRNNLVLFNVPEGMEGQRLC